MDTRSSERIWTFGWSVLGVVFGALGLSFPLLSLGSASNRQPCIGLPEGDYYDFGIIDENQYVRHEFPIVNEGRRTLVVSAVKTGCGCASAEISERSLGPGHTAGIIVSYRGRPVATRENIPVWVISNDPAKPVVRLLMTGAVRTRVFWYPQAISFFGKPAMKIEPREIRFLTFADNPVELKRIRPSSSHLGISCTEQRREVKCSVTIDSNCPIGNSTERIAFDIEVGNDVREVSIPVYLMLHE
jgi:hypothetical protein